MNKIILKSFTLLAVISVSNIVNAGSRSSANDLMSQLSQSGSLATNQAQTRFFSTLPQCSSDSEIPAQVTAESPALVFNDPATLKDAFSFKKTLEKLAEGAEQPTTALELLTTMVDSHQLTSATNPESDVSMKLDERELEANMSPQAMLDEFVPVGLFNRFEMTPLDGSNCGEYRIVYANPRNPVDPTLSAGFGRFFIIFEGALANPLPHEGVRGCLPIANFWASLANGKSVQEMTTEEKTAAVTQFEQFYYQGLTTTHFGTPVTIEPVVQHKSYRPPFGQVRTNIFLEFNWQLREFRTGFNDQGNAIFTVETVKDNALAELFNQDHDFNESDTNNIDRFIALRDDFQQEFISTMVSQLASPENTAINSFEVINQIVLPIPNKYNEFQSDSQSSKDDVSRTNNTDPQFRLDIDASLVDINTSLGRSGNGLLTTSHMLERAEASTCGGCHQTSNNAVVGVDEDGNNILWPASLGFVHIDEEGDLSPALKNSFLPAREKVLESFVCNPPKLTLDAKDGSLSAHIDSLTYNFNDEHPEGRSHLSYSTLSSDQGPSSERWWGGWGFSEVTVKVQDESGNEHDLFLRGTKLLSWGYRAKMNAAANFANHFNSTLRLSYERNDNLHLTQGHYKNTEAEKLSIKVKKWRGAEVETLDYHVDINILESISSGTEANLNLNQGEWKRFTINTGADQVGKTLKVTTQGNDPDADLYVRFNASPTTTQFDCRGFSSSSNEICELEAQSGTYHISVRGFTEAQNVTMEWEIN